MNIEKQDARPRHSEDKWRAYNELRLASFRSTLVPLAVVDAILLLEFAGSNHKGSFGTGLVLAFICLASWAWLACLTALWRIRENLDRDALYWERRVTLAWKVGIGLSAGLLVLAAVGLLLGDALASPALEGWALPIGALGVMMAHRMWARRHDPTDVFKIRRIG